MQFFISIFKVICFFCHGRVDKGARGTGSIPLTWSLVLSYLQARLMDHITFSHEDITRHPLPTL